MKAVYEDFKSQLTAGVTKSQQAPVQTSETNANGGSATTSKPKRRAPARKKAKSAEDGEVAISPDSPKFDKNLDTSRLRSFYEQFEPGSAPEKILIFLKFLMDEAGIEHPNSDQVYTCFYALKERAPTAFAQAFRDTANKKGFVEFNSATDIQVTMMGENHFNHDLKRADTE